MSTSTLHLCIYELHTLCWNIHLSFCLKKLQVDTGLPQRTTLEIIGTSLLHTRKAFYSQLDSSWLTVMTCN